MSYLILAVKGTALEEEAELSRLLRVTARCASLEEFIEQLPLAAGA